MKNRLRANPRPPDIDGFTPEQQFFIAQDSGAETPYGSKNKES